MNIFNINDEINGFCSNVFYFAFQYEVCPESKYLLGKKHTQQNLFLQERIFYIGKKVFSTNSLDQRY